MTTLFLQVMLALAYAPVALTALLWVVAYLAALLGDRRLLEWLNRRLRWGEHSPR
jgi:hypothetical protein